MKAQTLFVVASTLVSVLASPILRREARVVTVYENVVHVVFATSTVWVKATPKPAPPANKNKDDGYDSYKPPIHKEEPTIPKDDPAASPKDNLTPPKAKPSPPQATPTPVPTPTQEPPSTYASPEELIQKENVSPVEKAPQPSTPVPEPTTSSTSSKAPEPTPPTSNSGSSGSYGGDLENPDSPAEATYYNTGLGSCGVTSTDDEYVVAISHVLMDAKSTGNPNNNPLCG
jgi:hypothetical protein